MGPWLFVSCLLGILHTQISSGYDCIKRINGTTSTHGKVSATFDLCDFVVTNEARDGWYEVVDNRTVGNIEYSDITDFSFYFNVAAVVAKPVPDPECDNWNATWRVAHGLELGYCSNIQFDGLPNATCSAEDIVSITARTAAYQAKKGQTHTDQCWRLHDGVSEPVWSFVDADNPAVGVQVTYQNGDWCGAYGKNREFKMKFKCAKEQSLVPAFIETVFEPPDRGCEYEFVKETTRGCPTECVVENDLLCAGHGVCDYDWAKEQPKCFCYNGWYGADCTLQSDPNREVIYQDSDNSYVGALVVVILLLMVILFILGYLFVRYTRIKSQPFDFKFLAKQKRQRARGRDSDEYADTD